MSENAINKPSLDAATELTTELPTVKLSSHPTESSFETGTPRDGIEVLGASQEILPLLDVSMSEEEIAVIVKNWDPTKVFRGKQNSERPRQVIQWMLEKTNTTADVSNEITLSEALQERERRIARAQTITSVQKKLKPLTPEQTLKLEIARSVSTEITFAQKRVELEASKGLGNLLSFIEDLEGYVMDQCGNANVVRLFNGIDDKTGGKDRDLIIAKRTLVVMLANELNAQPSQF